MKTDIETSVELFHPLFKEIWDEEQVTSEWKEGYSQSRVTSAPVPVIEE